MITVVEPCPKCTGWHPQRSTCPRRPNAPAGLRVCRHCGHYHLAGTPDLCSQHWNCDCDEKAKLKITVERRSSAEWAAEARVWDDAFFVQARSLEVLFQKLHEQLILKGRAR